MITVNNDEDNVAADDDDNNNDNNNNNNNNNDYNCNAEDGSNMTREEWCRMFASLMNLSTPAVTSCMSASETAAAAATVAAMSASAQPSAALSCSDKLHRWAMARDSLALQVIVLEKQTSAQKEQIRNLEGLLDVKHKDFSQVGEAPNAADLMDEIAKLKRKCSALQREKIDAQRRLNIANVEIGRLQATTSNNNYAVHQQKQQTHQQLFEKQQSQLPSSQTTQPNEVEKLRQTIQKLVSDNQQKNLEITTLRQALDKRARFRDASSEGLRKFSSPTNGSVERNVSNVSSGHVTVPPPTTQSFDINAQLRRLLMDDEMLATDNAPSSSIAHSSSFPTNLCIAQANGNTANDSMSQFQRSATTLTGYNPTSVGTTRASPIERVDAGMHASTSYTSGLSAAHATRRSDVNGAYMAFAAGGRPPTATAAAFASAAAALWASSSTNVADGGVSSARQPFAPHYYDGAPPAITGSSYVPPGISNFAVAGSYQPGTSSPAVARQLAAELDELRHSSDFQQRYSPSMQLYGHSASLPRPVHIKSNSMSADSSLPRVCQQQKQQQPQGFVSYAGRMSVSNGRASLSSDASSSAPANGVIPKSSRRNTSGLPRMNVASDDEMASGRPSTATAGARRRTRTHAAVTPTASADANTKNKRGRTRSTLRNFFGRLARSTSQDLRHVSLAASMSQDRLAIGSRDHHASAADFHAVMRPSMSARFTEHRDGNLAGAVSSISARAAYPDSDANTSRDRVTPPLRPAVQQFVDWPTDEVCAWLEVADLGHYAHHAARYIRSGRHLLNLTNAELEKELQIKSGLHRRRLKCLLNCIERNTGELVEPADRMDIHQVMLWLDDIGVPQYRDIFAAQHIDGQMLICLTAADLVEMRITSAMNHATFARAIQLLRVIEFRLHRLEKRFSVSDSSRCASATANITLPTADVERWTAACVADWLRSIDLAEFTPNLMFAGVHGALMVNEPTFSAESLAEVLQIPVHKTLLRRHLTTHFNKALGAEIIGQKRDALAQSFVTHLSPTLRIKLVKKGFLSARKKSKNDIFVEPHVPVCPTAQLAGAISASTLDANEETQNDSDEPENEFMPTSPTTPLASQPNEMTNI